MGLKVSGLERVRKNLARTEQKAKAGSLQGLREAAQIVVEEARKNAPIDKGDLENAIVAVESRERTSLGRFGQTQIQVGVDVSKLNLEQHGGYDYSIKMHEDPNYNLGPLSQAKQNNSSNTVGYKYLARALKDKTKEARAAIEAAIRRAMK
ncbi:putative tail-component [Pseudomonas phage nickie]|uniref:Putative tail-component n=1 Tax=Pseudomonas phage nickie TaxID=2048977 RepID=A0A2H4P6Y5_9CAUD|nr:putative tail-component [Pseudomonas phage nickie]ATW57954.1 putative tail-component [Pseudomonas phage nickie]